MAFYLKSGNTFKVSSKKALDIHDFLPPANYIIKQDMSGDLFLEEIESFEIKGKLYGDTAKNAERIINTFKDRISTGVALVGEKGSGKTLLSKLVCILAAKINVPTILINAPWFGDKFNSFIQNIDQSCIILFDEFEKVYNREQQEQVLTLLDGVFPSRKLFILTCNDKNRIDYYMRNRPGRIYYMIDYKGLDIDFIREYCNDNLLNKQFIDTICKISSLFTQFNFDMLKAMVEEMNRYNETPQEVLKVLNVKPEFNSNHKYKVQVEINGKEVNSERLEYKEWTGVPLTCECLAFWIKPEDHKNEDDDDLNWPEYIFTISDLKTVNPTNGGEYTYINSNNVKLILTKIPETNKVSYFDLF